MVKLLLGQAPAASATDSDRGDGSAINEMRRNDDCNGLRWNGGSSRLRVEQGWQIWRSEERTTEDGICG
ncbi:hypothetical protein, partial [Carboxylicivirga sp. N1Y90]|uniref:hypothetical protein n=1 Tax=Carboxylicivirga fragile TaxID=3417571 RepID=UPI003D33EA7D|nr:hypothetical protein [Marinilabiliaceae bacterium N1Y90]